MANAPTLRGAFALQESVTESGGLKIRAEWRFSERSGQTITP